MDVGRLLAFGALDHVERDLLAFLQSLETLSLNRAEVSEQIFATFIRGNEAEALGVVEPLNQIGRASCRERV